MAIQVSFKKEDLKKLFDLHGEQLLFSVGYNEKGLPDIFAQSFEPDYKRRTDEAEEKGEQIFISHEKVKGCPYPPGCRS